MKRIAVYIMNERGAALLVLLAVVLGVALGLAAFHRAEAVIGGVGNVTDSANPHNLSSTSGGIHASTEKRVCIFCHTPHRAMINNSGLINAPLWNHTLSSFSSYVVKSPGQFDNTPGPAGLVNMLSSPGQPDGASKMCLSCHDGTVSVGSVSSQVTPIAMAADACLDASGMIINSVACGAYIGTDLTTKHVVSIPMNDSLIANSSAGCVGGQSTKVVYPWAGVNSQPGSVILRPTNAQYGTTYGVSYPGSGMPANGKYHSGYRYGVQCSTCHDPHYWVNTADQQTTGYKFLVIGFTALCQACHDNC